MHTRSLAFTLLVTSLFLSSCSKNSDSGSGGSSFNDVSLVVSGKGVRKIAEVFNWNQEDLCFQSTGTIGWDGANKVEWIYNFTALTTSAGLKSFKGYRRTYQFNNGDSLTSPAFPPSFSNEKAGIPDAYYFYAPGTTTLWYYNPKLTREGSNVSYASTYGREGLYPNGDYISTNYSSRYYGQNGGYVKNLNTVYTLNGVEKGINLTIGSGIEKDLSRCQSAGLDLNGRPLLFSLTGDSLKVMNAETKTQVAAGATDAMSTPYPNPTQPKGDLFVHRTSDGGSFVILLIESIPVSFSSNEIYVASFKYDVAGNKVSNIVPRTLLSNINNSIIGRKVHANDNGVIYYLTKDDTIDQVTSSGKAPYKTGFVGSKDIHVTYMNIIKNKLFLVVSINVCKYYIGQVMKARSALCVVE